MELKVQKLVVLPRVCILAVVAFAVAALPAVAAAQVPATNASGGQYLPAVPGGGGNVEEGQLARSKDDRGKAGMKSMGDGAAGSGDTRIGLLLPLILVLSGLAAAVFVALGPGTPPAPRRRRTVTR